MFKRLSEWYERNTGYIAGTTAITGGLWFIIKPETVPDWILIIWGIYLVSEGLTNLADNFIDKRIDPFN